MPSTTQERTQRLWLELIWLTMTGLVAIAVLFPILRQTDHYPFVMINAIFVIVLLTLFRYVFFLQFTFLRNMRILKIILVFLSIPLVFILINNLNHFLTYLDDHSIDSFISDGDNAINEDISSYIRSQMLLFGIGSVIISIIFPFRMIVSVWRQHNRGTT